MSSRGSDVWNFSGFEVLMLDHVLLRPADKQTKICSAKARLFRLSDQKNKTEHKFRHKMFVLSEKSFSVTHAQVLLVVQRILKSQASQYLLGKGSSCQTV